MSHPLLRDARFYEHLVRIDADTAGRAQAAGCPCGDVLHVAHFPRKPRGGRHWRELGADYATRWSYCCARDGCRKRTTPPSVRFLGRRWYLGVVVLLAGVLVHGVTGYRVKGIAAHLRIPRRTLERWRVWWVKALPTTPLWRGAGLMPPLVAAAMPCALLDRFGGDEDQRLVAALRWLRPITTTSSGRSG